jgi:hypothetical protein
MIMRTIFLSAISLSLVAVAAVAQTTRTSPSASSTTSSIPSSSSTSANSPCSRTNPSSPCYSANAPRDPCYSALAPDQPCSTTVTPNSAATEAPPAVTFTTSPTSDRAFTADQAKAQIEAQGYSEVSGLKKDSRGVWRGKAVKDGSRENMTLHVNGSVTAN